MLSQMTLDPDFFICCICQIEYNQLDRIPRMLPLCGHTFCTTCLEKMLENQNHLKCPLDQAIYQMHGRTIQQIPVNIVLKQMSEQRSKVKNDLCQIHEGELRNLVCLDDKCRVCKYCVDYGTHRGHTIKYIKDIQAEAEVKKGELETVLREFETYSTKMNELLRQDKEKASKVVRDKFIALRTSLNKQEQELLIRVNSLYEQRRFKRVHSGANRETEELKKNVEEKIASLKEMQMDSEFFQTLGEPRMKPPVRLEYEALMKQSQDFREELNEALEDYNASVMTRQLEARNIRIEFQSQQEEQQQQGPVAHGVSSWGSVNRGFPFSLLQGLSNTLRSSEPQSQRDRQPPINQRNMDLFSAPVGKYSRLELPSQHNNRGRGISPFSLSQVPSIPVRNASLGITGFLSAQREDMNGSIVDGDASESFKSPSCQEDSVVSQEVIDSEEEVESQFHQDLEDQIVEEGDDENSVYYEANIGVGEKSPPSTGSWFI